jgi:hypothetical protein
LNARGHAGQGFSPSGHGLCRRIVDQHVISHARTEVAHSHGISGGTGLRLTQYPALERAMPRRGDLPQPTEPPLPDPDPDDLPINDPPVPGVPKPDTPIKDPPRPPEVPS